MSVCYLLYGKFLCFLIDFRSSAVDSVNATEKEVGTLAHVTVQVKEDESLSACGKENSETTTPNKLDEVEKAFNFQCNCLCLILFYL